jgi:hypothetical protein
MKLKISGPAKIILLALFFIGLVVSRFYNLNKTARFIWDESSDLVNIHQIYVERKLTLIGPISEDGNKVFSSLTYYVLLPFAVVGNFDPVSTAYGAAFWGVIAGLLIFYLVFRVNRKLAWVSVPLIILWYPLVETGRWAWNPNFIPLFVALSLIFYLNKSNLSGFLSGLALGLSVHLHYLAVFASFGFGAVLFAEAFKRKDFNKLLMFTLGWTLAILPFILFDLTHPPGLFLSRILYFNYLGEKLLVFQNLVFVINSTFVYFTHSEPLKVGLLVALALLVYFDIKDKSKGIRFAVIFLIQILGLGFVANYYPHYILPAIPFLIIYLFYPRRGFGQILSLTIVGILFVSGVLSFPSQITQTTWEGDIASTRFITNTIAQNISEHALKNNNLAVLGSPDPNTYGRRYRDLLLIKGVDLKTKGEYAISDHLFLITTSPLEAVRNDPAFEISFFKNGNLMGEWRVPESDWKIFLLSRSPI